MGGLHVKCAAQRVVWDDTLATITPLQFDQQTKEIEDESFYTAHKTPFV
jgi:hypothetical protein